MYLNNNGNNNTKMITAPSSSSASLWWWWWRWSTENKRRKAAAAATTMIVCLCARENKNHQQQEEFNSEKFHSRARTHSLTLFDCRECFFRLLFMPHSKRFWEPRIFISTLLLTRCRYSLICFVSLRQSICSWEFEWEHVCVCVWLCMCWRIDHTVFVYVFKCAWKCS